MSDSGATKEPENSPKRRTLVRSTVAVGLLAVLAGTASKVRFHTQEYFLTSLQEHALEQGFLLHADALDIKITTASPSATLKGLSISHGSYDSHINSATVHASISWRKILSGSTVPDVVIWTDARITLDISDWHTPALPAQNHQELFRLLTKPLQTPETLIELEDTKITLAGPEYTVLGDLNLNGYVDSGSELSKISLELNGAITEKPVSSTVILEVRNQTLLQSGSMLNIEYSSASGNFSTELTVEELTSEQRITASFYTSGTRLKGLMEAFNGPALQTANLSGTLAIAEDSLQANNVALSLDNTNISGDLEISKTNAKPKITLTVFSDDTIPLDELLPGPVNKGKPPDDIVLESTVDYFFSKDPPAIYQWVKNWDILAQIQLTNLKYLGYDVADLTVNANVENSRALIAINSSRFASGNLVSKAQYEIFPSSPPAGFVTVSIQNMNLEKFSVEPDVNDIITAGTLTTEAEFWFEGLSSAELAASLDGDIYALLEDGSVDSMAIEVAGADIMESLHLLFRRKLQQIEITCGYANIHFDSGKGVLEHFLVDSDDTLFSASGFTDFNSEALNLTLNPIPHDASLLTATTPIHLIGTLTNPKIRPGRKLYARVAAAALLVSLTGPAAAFLPFIGIGDGEKSRNCNELFATQ